MKVYIGADHKGYNLKEAIKGWLRELGYDMEDVGALMLNPKDDYTIYASKVGTKVGLNKGTRGILFCGSGVGVDVVREFLHRSCLLAGAAGRWSYLVLVGGSGGEATGSL